MKRSVRSTPRVVLLLTLLCGGPLIPSPTLGQAAGDERQERLQERDRKLWAEAQRLRAQGKLDEAITAAEKMLAIEREVLGAEHPEVAVSLEWLAKVYIEREDFAAARKARQEVLALRGKLHGRNHGR